MSRPAEVIVGVDVGTTAVRVAAFDVHGDQGQLPARSGEHPLVQPEPGWQVQNPLTVLASIDAAVAECVGLLGNARILACSGSPLTLEGNVAGYAPTLCLHPVRLHPDHLIKPCRKVRLGGAHPLDKQPCRVGYVNRARPTVTTPSRRPLRHRTGISAAPSPRSCRRPSDPHRRQRQVQGCRLSVSSPS